MDPILHIYLLWSTEENTQYGKFLEKPLPEIIVEEEEWEIKDIIDSRTRNRVNGSLKRMPKFRMHLRTRRKPWEFKADSQCI